ncbi:MAG: hypothetical protein Ct9H90mP5_08310 [Acidimicrobiaceae bacterium]|nr:MAG: hypothetical protein Ct9H90mP5_08310 [Acidimicrobiaceae bacterium]
MTLPIARDLVPLGIRINTIAPGLIDTPIYGEGEASDQFKPASRAKRSVSQETRVCQRTRVNGH